MSPFDRALAEFDRINGDDPRSEPTEDGAQPKELVYARRMSETLDEFEPGASEALRLATRAQHIARWKIPRSDFPPGRVGYRRWRSELMDFHATVAADVLRDAGYGDDTVERVGRLLRKQGIKRDPEVQVLEDVACLVFLRYHLAEFAAEHEEAKVVDVLRKTWRKMSERGRAAATRLNLDRRSSELLGRALHDGGEP